MVILSEYLDQINLNDVNFDEDTEVLKLLFMLQLWFSVIDLNNVKYLK